MLAALVLGAVVAVDPGGLAPFGPLKWLAVSTLGLAAVAAGLGGPGAQMARRPLVLWAVFLAIVAVAAVVGVDPVYAWIGTPERRFGALTWLLCALAFVVGPRAAHLPAAAAVAVGVAGAWAVAEALGWEPIELVGTGDRPIGPLGSSAYLGAAMVLLVPAAWAHGARWSRAATVLGGIALVASGARAAWFGAVVAAVMFIVAHRRLVDARRVALGVAAVVGVAALTGVLGRVGDLVSDERGGAAGRLDEWRVAARVVADHPVTGVGPEGYRIAFGRAVDDEYEIEHGRDPLPDRAHSAVLDVAATVGVPGAFAYLALLAALAPFVARAVRAGDVVAVGVVGYAVQSLVLFPLAELDPVAWALAGAVVGRVVKPDESVTVRLPVVARGAVALAAAGALVVGAVDVVADRRARSILDGDDVVASAASSLRPDVVRYHLVEARALEREGDLGGALDALDDALDVSPRDPVVRGEHARLLLDVDVVAALADLEALADDDPRNAEVLLRLGVARARTGDVGGARAAWFEALRLAPGSDAARINLERLRD